MGQPIISTVTTKVENAYQAANGDSISEHWLWTTGGVWCSSDGTPASFVPYTGNFVIGWSQGSPTTQFTGIFNDAGLYIIKVTATLTYHDDTTNKDVLTCSGDGYIGGSASALAPSASTPSASAHSLSAHQTMKPRDAGTPPLDGTGVPVDTLIVKVNDTSDTTDDKYVRLKSSNPAGRLFTTPVTILNPSTTPVTVKVSNSDNRLGFATGANPSSDASSLSVSVPANSSSTFYFTGEAQSSDIGDAKIDVTDSSSGASYATKMVTVFWFRGPSDVGGFGKPSNRVGGDMGLAVGQNYVIQPNVIPGYDFFGAGGLGSIGMSMTAGVVLMPTGVNLNAPQVKPLRLGIEQNGTLRVDTYTYSAVIQWTSPNPVQGLKTQPIVKEKVRTATTTIPAAGKWCNDTSNGEPFYARSSEPANSDSGLVSVDAISKATDNVSVFVSHTYSDSPINAYDSAGNVVGTITYQLTSARITTDFRDWCTLADSQNAVKGQTEWLSEASWTMNATIGDHATITNQSVIPPPDVPTEDGIICSQAAQQHSDANTDVGTVTFTYPNVTPDP